MVLFHNLSQYTCIITCENSNNLTRNEPSQGDFHRAVLWRFSQATGRFTSKTDGWGFVHATGEEMALAYEGIRTAFRLNNTTVLFASSVLNLCELLSLRSDLQETHKVLYFHENQLVYPVRKHLERDFQYGYNQILSCMVADVIVFNSQFNKDSFLESIDCFMKLMPDHRPKDLAELIRPKCHVLYFPVMYPPLMLSTGLSSLSLADGNNHLVTSKPLHIVWPHRWEHDKGPDDFSIVLHKLMDHDMQFAVSLLGSHTTDIPESFKELIPKLGNRLLHSDHVPIDCYWNVISKADVVVSTAQHEFFGVAMMEASYAGCYPLCPNRLVYPELYPKECLYNTTQQLFKRLKEFCLHPYKARKSAPKINFDTFSWDVLKKDYSSLLLGGHVS